MVEREELVRDLAARFHIKGFEQSPIEREQAHQFLASLNDVKRRQHAETDKLQLESRTRNERHRPRSVTMRACAFMSLSIAWHTTVLFPAIVRENNAS